MEHAGRHLLRQRRAGQTRRDFPRTGGAVCGHVARHGLPISRISGRVERRKPHLRRGRRAAAIERLDVSAARVQRRGARAADRRAAIHAGCPARDWRGESRRVSRSENVRPRARCRRRSQLRRIGRAVRRGRVRHRNVFRHVETARRIDGAETRR